MNRFSVLLIYWRKFRLFAFIPLLYPFTLSLYLIPLEDERGLFNPPVHLLGESLSSARVAYLKT
ncbi:MAG TPA: hypothetical protein VFD00_02070, partial [Thermoclostridium sp.]|nr:hypothetical protein [Thermoclostridium sp.]